MEARRDSTLALSGRLFELARPYRLHIAGGLIHIVLVIALIALAIHFLKGGKSSV